MKAGKYGHDVRSLRDRALSGMRLLGAGHAPLHRFRLGLEFALSGHREVDGMVAHHAAIARTLGEQLGLPDDVLDALAAAYERWDGRGLAGRARRRTRSRSRRGWRRLAEFIEVANRVGGVEAARELARERRGKQFDPAISAICRVRRRRCSCPVSTRSAPGTR